MGFRPIFEFDADADNDIESLVRTLKRWGKAGRSKINSAMREAGRFVKKDVSKTVRDEINLKKKDADKSIWIEAKASGVKIVVSRKPIPLIKFGPRLQERHPPPRRGITVRVRKREPRERFRHHFVSVMPSGHKGIFVRRTKQRKPIDEEFGPTVVGVLAGQPGMLNKVEKRGKDRLVERLNSKIQLMLKKEG